MDENNFIDKYIGITTDKVTNCIAEDYEKKMKKISKNFVRTDDPVLITVKNDISLSIAVRFFDVYKVCGPIKRLFKAPGECEVRIPRTFEIAYFIYPYSDEVDIREWLAQYGFDIKKIPYTRPFRNRKNTTRFSNYPAKGTRS